MFTNYAQSLQYYFHFVRPLVFARFRFCAEKLILVFMIRLFQGKEKWKLLQNCKLIDPVKWRTINNHSLSWQQDMQIGRIFPETRWDTNFTFHWKFGKNVECCDGNEKEKAHDCFHAKARNKSRTQYSKPMNNWIKWKSKMGHSLVRIFSVLVVWN